MEREILIVDDDPVVRHLLTSMLSKAGYRPLTAKSGMECLGILRSAPATEHLPALILLDWQLADMSGFDVLCRIRETKATAQTPVIIISAITEAEIHATNPNIQADGFLEKPFEPQALLSAVSAALKRQG